MSAAIHETSVLEELLVELQTAMPNAIAAIANDGGRELAAIEEYCLYNPKSPPKLKLPALVLEVVAGEDEDLHGSTGGQDVRREVWCAVVHQSKDSDDVESESGYYIRAVNLALGVIRLKAPAPIEELYDIEKLRRRVEGVSAASVGGEKFRLRSGLVARLYIRTTQGA